MGGPARPLHEPGNHRSSERTSHRHSADCGSLIERPTLLRITAPTPRPGARSSRIFIDTFFRHVGNQEILFIKRNEQRFWTRTAAREDAESTLTHLMHQESIG